MMEPEPIRQPQDAEDDGAEYPVADIFQLPVNLSFQEWTGKLYMAGICMVRSGWFMADVLNNPHADTETGIQGIAEVQKQLGLGLSDGTLNNLKTLGRHFPPGKRNLALSQRHHQLLVPMMRDAPEECQEIIHRAVKEEWPTRTLEEYLRERRAGVADGAGTPPGEASVIDNAGANPVPRAQLLNALNNFRMSLMEPVDAPEDQYNKARQLRAALEEWLEQFV